MRALNPDFRRCPDCGGTASTVVDRKYLLTQLRRCGSCRLQYRVPTDAPADNARYYEDEYDWGFTTTMPDDARLAQLKRNNFAGCDRDYAERIRLLRRCGLAGGGQRLFDYGCSWGYGSYQLMQAGFAVTAFEIAPTRRRFARDKLGVNTVDDVVATVADPAHRGTYDGVFACHVVEHVPRPTCLFAMPGRCWPPAGFSSRLRRTARPRAGACIRAGASSGARCTPTSSTTSSWTRNSPGFPASSPRTPARNRYARRTAMRGGTATGWTATS
jgi:2-polyprenyl-3-methyl-5-hydroxy-6-metoxy-1,4-benzoquinol methylase